MIIVVILEEGSGNRDLNKGNFSFMSILEWICSFTAFLIKLYNNNNDDQDSKSDNGTQYLTNP